MRNEIDINQRTIRQLERKNSNLKVRLFVESPSQPARKSTESLVKEFCYLGKTTTLYYLSTSKIDQKLLTITFVSLMISRG